VYNNNTYISVAGVKLSQVMQTDIKVVKVSKDKYFNGEELIGYRLARLALPEETVGSSEDYHLMEGEHLFSHSFITDSYRKIMGRTLTIIDASIVDKQHNKAIKDLLRQVFNDEICFSSEWGFDQNVIQRNLDVDSMDGSEMLSVEDVLGIKE
jgi:hypothetical protein